MKRFLSLVLCFILVLGCMTLASAAEFSAAGAFDPTHVIYAKPDEIAVKDAIGTPMKGYPMDGDSRFMFEIPAELSVVTIIPLKNNASFQLFDGTTFRFGKISADTIGTFTLAAPGVNPSLIITPQPPRFWDSWPSWVQWTLKYILFGWVWMRWF